MAKGGELTRRRPSPFHSSAAMSAGPIFAALAVGAAVFAWTRSPLLGTIFAVFTFVFYAAGAGRPDRKV